MINLLPLMNLSISAAYAAGNAISEVYENLDFQVEHKDDSSPLTIADKKAHSVIVSYLDETKIPVFSEEGKAIPYEKRKNLDYYWLVDPLDGTKEFIKRNDEFTVNIALIHKQKAVLGIVYAPILKAMYYAAQGVGAFKAIDQGTPVPLLIKTKEEIQRVVVSRSHLCEETSAFLAKYPNVEVLKMGSSLKFMLIAENKADLYPRFSPTMEWDTAAAQAIVEIAGGQVRTISSGKAMMYNRINMLNGGFIVQ